MGLVVMTFTDLKALKVIYVKKNCSLYTLLTATDQKP